MASDISETQDNTEMTEYNGDKVVTMVDVLQEQQEFEEDANAVLGASDEKNCTYSKGYIKRQAIYACLTCCSDSKDDPKKRAGVCLACSLNCHENHDLVELYTKRNFRCDCGNPKFNSHPCQYTPNKTGLNDENEYNQNFSGLYCICHRPYPDPEANEEDEMIQCIICEDWLHSNHLEATVPAMDQYAEMICKTCMTNNQFLHDYSSFAVNNIENEEVDIGNDVSINGTTINIEEKVNGHDKINSSMDVSTLENETHDNSVPIEDKNADEEMETDVPENKNIELNNVEKNKQGLTENNSDDPQKKIDNAESKQTEDKVPDTEENVPEIPKSNEDTAATEETIPETPKLDENKPETKHNESETQKLDEDVPETQENVKETEEKVSESQADVPGNEDHEMTAATEANEKANKEGSENAKQALETEKQDKCSKPDSQNATTEESEIDSNKEIEAIDNFLNEISSDGNTEKTVIEATSTNEASTNEQTEKQPSETPETTSPLEGTSGVMQHNDDSHITPETSEALGTNKDMNRINETDTMDVSSTETNSTANKIQDTTHGETEENGGSILSEKTSDNAESPTDTDNVHKAHEEPKEQNNTNGETEENENSILSEKTSNNTESPTDTGNVDRTHEEPKEHKRKLSTEYNVEEDNISKKPKLDSKPCVRPKGVKKIFKGATFWPQNFRQILCKCNECLTMYKDLSVLFLTDPEDTVSVYEELGKQKCNGTSVTQYEKGMEALSSLDRIQQINAVTEYNNMRDKLLEFLKNFKDRKEVVTEEDIRAFFAGMKPRREPDGVYFCR